MSTDPVCLSALYPEEAVVPVDVAPDRPLTDDEKKKLAVEEVREVVLRGWEVSQWLTRMLAGQALDEVSNAWDREVIGGL